MVSKEPKGARDKFNLYSQEEIKKSIAELEEVKKQIDKRTEQLNKITETKLDLSKNTIIGSLNFQDLDSAKKDTYNS
jgi:hypothetical protein